MDFNLPEETGRYPIPRCSSANSRPSSLDLYEPTGETSGLPRSSSANSFRSYFGFYEPSIYGDVQSCPSNLTNDYIDVSPEQIQRAMSFDPIGETSSLPRSSSANSHPSSLGLYEPSTYFHVQSCLSNLANKYICGVSSEQIQHAMNFDPTGETSSLSMNSSTGSLPSFLGLYEPSMYFDAQLCPSNHTNEYIYGMLPEPFHLETNYQPLPSYGVEFRPTIGCEAPFNREGVSGWNQYSMPLVLGPQGETHWEAIQRIDREFLLWRRTYLDAIQENRDLKFRVQMLENHIVHLLVKNEDLEIRNNHSELRATYLETTSNSLLSVFNKLKDKVDSLELIIAQRDLNRLTIRMNEMNSQIANLEDKFTQLKDEVNQLKVQFSNPRTKLKRLTCVHKLKGTIKDFKGCRANVKQNIARLTSDICEFGATVADLETSDSVTELKIQVINLEMQIVQLFATASGLKNGLDPLEEILEMEHNKASRESTTGELFAQFWEDFKRVLRLG